MAQGMNVPSAVSPAQFATLRSLRQLLPSRKLTRSVMASPPTTTFTTTNALSAGRLWPAISPMASHTDYVMAGQAWSTARAAVPTIKAATVFNDTFVLYQNIDYGSGVKSANQWQQSLQHGGSRIVMWVKGQTGFVTAKVDDEYVSLTPQTVANDSNFYYYDFDFGSYAERRIDFIGYGNVPFGGFYTALTDLVRPAPLRGPRVVIQGDSFIEGTGATYSCIHGYLSRMMDRLGWENFISDGRGSSGLLAGTPTYRSRFVTDVVPYSPDLIIIQGSVNDAPSTGAQLATEALALIALGQQYLPNAVFAFTSEPLKIGATAGGNAPFLRRDAVKSAVTGAGHLFLDIITRPTPIGFVPATNTLASSASINATSLSVNSVPVLGGTYKFADGTPFLAKAVSGAGPYTITTDAGGIGAAQSNGASMTQVGDCPWTGNGKVGATTGFGSCDIIVYSDGTHPSQSGHDMLGEMLASDLATALKAA